MSRRIGASNRWLLGPGAYFGAFVGSMVLAVLLGALDPWIGATAALSVLAIFVAIWSASTSIAGAIAALVCAALFADGFVVDQMGRLAWHGTVDLERLGALVFAAIVGLSVRAVLWLSRKPKPVPVITTVAPRRVPGFATRPHRTMHL